MGSLGTQLRRSCNDPDLHTPRYCPLWPSAARFCPFPIHFPGGHPSGNCSPLSTLNFGIPKNPKPTGKGASYVKSSQALYLRDTTFSPTYKIDVLVDPLHRSRTTLGREGTFLSNDPLFLLDGCATRWAFRPPLGLQSGQTAGLHLGDSP